MLVLSRGMDESIIINGNTRIKVLTILGRQVRLGIEAPNQISVIREELLESDRIPADDAPKAARPPGKAGGPLVDEEAGYPSG
jgi:carbon storage regulator